jgi:Zn-dependent protease
MDIYTPRLLFLIAMVAGVGILLWKDRDKVERHSILFFRRTKRGVAFIDKVASAHPKFWDRYGWVGVIAGVISIPIVAGNIGYAVFQSLSSGGASNGGVSFIAPGLVSQNQFQAGVSFVPVEYWVISIGILMIVHEFSHGIVARSQGFEINSVGWIIFGIIPGAFVEPKGENMLPGGESGEHDTGLWDQGTWTERLKVLAAGSWANYLTAGIFFLAALGVSAGVTQPSGVFYMAQDGMPAQEAGMNNGTLYAVNGQRLSNVDELMNISQDIAPGEQVTVWTSEGNFTLTTVAQNDSERGFMGVQVGEGREMKESLSEYQSGFEWFISLLETIAFLNLGIGFFNMLPAKPLDGGQMLETFVDHYSDGNETYLGWVNSFSLFVWLMIIGLMVAAIAL